MAPEHEHTDDLDVRLRWPAGGGEGSRPAGSIGGAVLPAVAPRSTGAPVELLAPGRATALQEALAALSARVEALGTTTAAFRTVVGDRLNDVMDQAARSQAVTTHRIDDSRRLQDRIMSGIEASLEEVELGMARLDAVATSLVGRFDEIADELAKLVGAGAERHEAHLEAHTATVVRTVDGRSDELERAVGALRDLTESSFEQLGDKMARTQVDVDLSPLERRLDDLAGLIPTGPAAERTDEVLAALGEMSAVVDALADASEVSTSSPLAEALGSLEDALARQGRLGDEIAALTQEVGALRRRMAVRAKPLDDAAIASLADALALRLVGADPPPSRRRTVPGTAEPKSDADTGSQRHPRET